MYKTKLLRSIMGGSVLEFFKKSSITPEFLVVFRFLCALGAGIVLFFGNYLYSIIFLTIYQFVFLLDYVDGSLARAKGKYSLTWNRFDRAGHYFVSFLFLFAITMSFFLNNFETLFLVIGGIGSISILLALFIELVFLNRSISFKELKQIHENKGMLSGFYSFLPIDGAFTLFYFLILFNSIQIAIIILSVIQVLILVKKIYTLTKWKKNKK